MRVSIRKQDGTVERKDVQEIWAQVMQGWEGLDAYRLLIDFGDYCKADEGCCENPWNCDCDQETRDLVYFRDDTMFITYDGKLPLKMHKHKAAAERTRADLKKKSWTVEKGADGVIKVEAVAA